MYVTYHEYYLSYGKYSFWYLWDTLELEYNDNCIDYRGFVSLKSE